MSKYKDELNDLISRALADGVSDIHFSVGHYPTFRVSGNLVPLMNTRVFAPDDTMGYITELLSENFLQCLFL